MVISRLIYFLHPKQQALGVSARWIAKGFVAADIVSFMVQAGGGALMADQQNTENADLGRKIYMAGVGVQLFFVLLFVVVVVSFYRQLSSDIRNGTLKNRNRWIRPLVLVIFLVLILIVVRLLCPAVSAMVLTPASNVLFFDLSSLAAACPHRMQYCATKPTSCILMRCPCFSRWRP
jgi:hypothetical protein